MSSSILPNMGLIVPGVGTEPGPTWATDLNSDLGILDQHNHAAGQGVQITPSGLNINIDLTMQDNNLIDVNTVNFTPNLSPLPGLAPNLGCIYVAGNELYYNDESGNVVAITKTGSVNAGAGSITGLPSGTASVSYSSGNATYVFQSATNTPANIDVGSVIVRDVSANSNGITISAPPSLAANYSVQLPAALPVSTKILTIDSSGNIGDYYDVDNSTIVVNSGVIEVPPEGIQQINLAFRTTGSTVGAGGVAVSSSTGTYNSTNTGQAPSQTQVTTSLATITTTGRPVMLALQPTSGNNQSYVAKLLGTGGGFGSLYFLIFNGSSTVTLQSVLFGQPVNGSYYYPPSFFWMLDNPRAAGTYTYSFGASVAVDGEVEFVDVQLIAYEI
jgi:hypothetical protein